MPSRFQIFLPLRYALCAIRLASCVVRRVRLGVASVFSVPRGCAYITESGFGPESVTTAEGSVFALVRTGADPLAETPNPYSTTPDHSQ